MRLLSALLLLTIISCNNPAKKEISNIAGTYKMMYQRVKGDNTDTTYKSLQQLKIFTEDLMMYANINSPDSISSFGIGSYTINKDTIVENVFYNAADTTRNDNPGTFKLIITKTDKGYKQFIPNIISGGKPYELTEEYESVGTDAKSQMDGAWRQIKQYTIKGKDTLSETTGSTIEYKAYFMGYVIWGLTSKDSTNRIHTGIGFGKFSMTGNKVKESMMASTYYGVRGHDFDIDIEMNGTDSYTQTINNPDGTKSVEIYSRLKKE